jgi:hypothetical protein
MLSNLRSDRRWRGVWAAACGAILAGGLAPARADVLNFDDITVSDPRNGQSMPAVYHGFNVGPQFFVETDSDYEGPSSFYMNSYGAATAPNAISNDSGAALTSISRSTAFDFTGADVSSFAGLNQYQVTSARTLTLTGFLGGVQVGAPVVVTLDPTAYHFATVGFNNVDTVKFAAAGGGPEAAGGPTESFFLLDDFTFSEVRALPTPGVAVGGLALFGVLGVGQFVRRRRLAH